MSCVFKNLSMLVVAAGLAVSGVMCVDSMDPCDELAVTAVRCMMSECQTNPSNISCEFCSDCVLQPDLEKCAGILGIDQGFPYVCDEESAERALKNFSCTDINIKVRAQCI